MSIILSLDTTNGLSFSLFKDDVLIDTFFKEGVRISDSIAKFFIDFFSGKNLSLDSIDYISCVVGPGSYTSLRVGYAFVLGLCVSLNKNLIDVNLLEAMLVLAQERYSDRKIFPIIDANNGNLYILIDGNVRKISVDDFRKILENLSDECVIVSPSDIIDSFEYGFAEKMHIRNVSECVYKFIDKKVKGMKFCDIYKYRLCYFDK